MKQLIYFFTLLAILSCKNTKVMSSDISEKNVTVDENSDQPKDSIIRKLQNENDLVLAFEVETVAWAKTSSYKILAKKGDTWKAYTAHVSRMPQSQSTLQPAEINNAQAERLWQFFKDNKIGSLPGDKDGNFCDDESKNCNINDGTVWHLLIMTKNKFDYPTYYEPAFFEKCCPGNKERELFLQAANKLSALIQTQDDEDDDES